MQHLAMFSLFVFAMLFVACDKDENGIDNDTTFDYLMDADADEVVETLILPSTELEEAYATQAARGGDRFSGQCFSLVYPITIAFADGSTATVVDSAELKTELRNWAATRPGRGNRPSFVYPIEVVTADGMLEQIDGRLEMRQLLRSCVAVPEPCVSLVYPLDVQLGDRTLTIETAEDLRMALRRYRQSNPDGPRPSFVYPVMAEFADGTTVEINARSEWLRVRQACTGRDLDCYRYIFPVTVENAAGREVTVRTLRQLRRVLSHAGPGGRHRLQFPFAVTLNSGDTFRITERADLAQLRGLCD